MEANRDNIDECAEIATPLCMGGSREHCKEITKIGISSMLDELDYVNTLFATLGLGEIKIHIQDYHDEYSPERVDPCPDYYGMLHMAVGDGIIGGRGDWMQMSAQLSAVYDAIEIARDKLISD